MNDVMGKNIMDAAFTTPVEWRISAIPVAYPEAVRLMEERVEGILDGSVPELVWLLEHPPLYTAGTSAAREELLTPDRFPVFPSGRGGRYTYHGPGQRIAYVVSDLRRRGQDLKQHVWRLEELVIRSLAEFGVEGFRSEGRIGIWVKSSEGKEEKIAAIGVRARKWVAYHGLSINVCPDLEHFSGIVPCGLAEYGVTSLHKLRVNADIAAVDAALRKNWKPVFGTS